MDIWLLSAFTEPILLCKSQKVIPKITKNRKNASKVVQTCKNVMFGQKAKFLIKKSFISKNTCWGPHMVGYKDFEVWVI